MRKNWKRRAPLFILKAAAALLIAGGVTMLLWNATIATIFHLTAITYWQALGILALSKLLFGMRRGGGGFGRRHMMRRWNNMTPEEQEAMKAKWGGARGEWRAC